MSPNESTIHHVSDTSLWVAYYRAKESLRPDALFHDPLAQVLIGERGRKIAESMKGISLYVDWSVVIRTCIIDRFIENLVKGGVDTVINLGAGMDTRPYRLDLPPALCWVEVDYPHVIEHKEKLLNGEAPLFSLERVKLDLSQRGKRQELFSRLNASSKKSLILTEGVIPYLTEEQVATLAEDLRSQGSFRYWMTEYFSPEMYPVFRTRKRMKQLKNSPFLFFPEEWFGFFKERGWKPYEIRYTAEESLKLGRIIPAPWWSYLLLPFIPKKTLAKFQKRMGYVLWTPTP